MNCILKDDCACPDNWDPVCGEDDQTYGNECESNCNDVGIKCHHECPCLEQVPFMT